MVFTYDGTKNSKSNVPDSPTESRPISANWYCLSKKGQSASNASDRIGRLPDLRSDATGSTNGNTCCTRTKPSPRTTGRLPTFVSETETKISVQSGVSVR